MKKTDKDRLVEWLNDCNVEYYSTPGITDGGVEGEEEIFIGETSFLFSKKGKFLFYSLGRS